MLALPASDPRNWFRNSFVHFMDCPHGNWWFYVWHRGYIGYLEETIRSLSEDPMFTLPYWDWTALPRIPEGMFTGALAPTDAAYAPYTKDIDTFTAFIQPSLKAYWDTLAPAQRTQLAARGYTSFDLLWNDVTGFNPQTQQIVPGNESYAETARARFLTAGNPDLDKATADTCSQSVIDAGLEPTEFYNEDITLSFTSTRTATHTSMPNGSTSFSILEGQPHNHVHNYIGGVGPWDPGPYGNMTNFLSPVDPIFFLHHANMDRLWAEWTAKQQQLGLPILPTGDDLAALSNDPFLFFVRADGSFVLDGKAGDYLSTDRFGYAYAAPTAPTPPRQVAAARKAAPIKATVVSGVAAVELPAPSAAEVTRPVVVALTLARPADSNARQFDVLVNAPADVTSADVGSPYYGGSIAFFGPPMHGMAHDATFVLRLHPKARALTEQATTRGPLKLQLRLVPHTAKAGAPPTAPTAPPLKAMSARRL
ncbi:MAG TPA: tyrosinase family protein [Kofleriaceae bacterium]|nr:tyrosinase family protein [Kofleriaceae bacterium]